MLRTAISAGLIGATLLLTACSSGGSSGNAPASKVTSHISTSPAAVTPTARELWDAAADKVATYKSIDVRSVDNSTQVADAGVPIDMAAKGKTDDTGDTALTFKVNGRNIEAFTVKSQWYLRSSAAYWEQQTGSAATAAKYADKWVKMPTSFTMRSPHFSELIDDFTDKTATVPAAMRQSTTQVSSTTVDGQPVWKLSAKDGQVSLISKRTGEVLEYSSPKRSSNGFVVQRMQMVSHDRDYSMKAPTNAVTFEG